MIVKVQYILITFSFNYNYSNKSKSIRMVITKNQLYAGGKE